MAIGNEIVKSVTLELSTILTQYAQKNLKHEEYLLWELVKLFPLGTRALANMNYVSFVI